MSSTTTSRLAFLAGASIVVIGIAAPLGAATIPGISSVVVGPDVTDVVLISSIGDDLEYGVTESGSGLVTALVDDPLNGTIEQIGIASGSPRRVTSSLPRSISPMR